MFQYNIAHRATLVTYIHLLEHKDAEIVLLWSLKLRNISGCCTLTQVVHMKSPLQYAAILTAEFHPFSAQRRVQCICKMGITIMVCLNLCCSAKNFWVTPADYSWGDDFVESLRHSKINSWA